MRDTKNLRHDAVGRRHGREPQNPHHRRKQVHAGRAQGRPQKDADRDSACQINGGEDVALLQALTERAGRVGANHIEEPDQAQGVAGHLRLQSMVTQVTGHVDGDENDLEAADKVTGHQPAKAGVSQRLAERLQDRLFAPYRAGTGKLRFAQGPRQRQDGQGRDAQNHQRLLPPGGADQLPGQGHDQELAERARRTRHTHGPGAAFCRNIAADNPVQHAIGAARLRHPDHHACAQHKQAHRVGVGHGHHTQGVQDRRDHNHPERAEAVSGHAGKNTGHAPAQVLHCNRQSVVAPSPRTGLRNGLQPEAKAMADAHAQRQDRRGADQHAGDGKRVFRRS